MSIKVIHEAAVVTPFDRALLSMLWVEELRRAAAAARVWQGKGGTHTRLVDAMMVLTAPEKLAVACQELRTRPTAHRADAPITKGDASPSPHDGRPG